MTRAAAMPDPPSAFSELLRWLRQRAGLSQNRLARLARVDPAYVHRMEAAGPDRAVVPRSAVFERLCAALELTIVERDRLFFAAGRCPPTLAAVGRWDPAVADLSDLLSDETMSEADRAELRQVIRVLVDRWRRSLGTPDA